MNGVSVDYETLEAMTAVFQNSANALQAMDAALGVAVGLLHAASFTGMVGAELMAQYLEGIQPHVQRLAGTCTDLSTQLEFALQQVRAADERIAARFGGGGSRGYMQRHGITSGFADGGVYALRQGEDGMAGYAISGTQAYSDTDTLLITGVGTTDEGFLNAAAGLPDDWQENNLAGVYNQAGFIEPFLGLDAGGSVQGIYDKLEAAAGIRLDGGNPAVRSVMDVILANANGDRELRLVGHSQGGAIIAAALQEVRREHPEVDLSFVEVVTFGSFGTNFPEGPQYHHYVFSSDPIAHAGVFAHMASPQSLSHYYQNLTVLPPPFPTKNPFEHHDLSLYEQHLSEFQEAERSGRFAVEKENFIDMTQAERKPVNIAVDIARRVLEMPFSMPW